MKFQLLLLLLPVIVFSCQSNNNQSESNDSDYRVDYLNKTEKYNKRLLGKDLNTTSSLEPKSFLQRTGKAQMIVITRDTDCSGCRFRSYSFLDNLKKKYSNVYETLVIGTGLDYEFSTYSKDYDIVFSSDEDFSIGKALNIYHTPTILNINKEGVVTGIQSLFPYDIDGFDEKEALEELIGKDSN